MNSRIAFLSVVLMISCVDRIVIDPKDGFKSQLVIDGFISDDPGPYTVKLFRSSAVEDNLNSAMAFSARTVSIADNLGNSEVLTETGNGTGIYVTKVNGIRGIQGRTYTLRIENRDGSIYESTPELIRPAGFVDSLYYEFETFKPLTGPTEYGYRVFMDSRSANNDENNFFRWRFSGTYRVQTNPELRTVPFGQGRIPDPPPCSGYVYNTELTMVGDCKCCVCWVRQAESTPIVSDNQFVVGGKFNRIEVGFVPVNAFTFFDRYQIQVEQLSLSKSAFDFWSTISSQKEGATSLFQPSFGEVKTNIHPINGGPSVLGIFYVAGKAKKAIFITKGQVPVPVPAPSAVISEQCDIVFPLASTNKPSGWD